MNRPMRRTIRNDEEKAIFGGVQGLCGFGSNPHGAVQQALCQCDIKQYKLVVKLGGILVDDGGQRWGLRNSGNERFRIGLIDGDLRRVDRFGNRNTALGKRASSSRS